MIVLRVPGAAPASEVLTQLRLIALRFPGDQPLAVAAAGRRLTLGRDWTVDGTPACLAALGEFGDPEVAVC